MTSFRTALLSVSPSELEQRGGSSPQDVGVLKALWNIFNELQGDGEKEQGGNDDKSSDNTKAAVSASELRKALGALRSSGSSNSRFQLDDMHDAAEALEEIFECLHRAQAGNSTTCDDGNGNNTSSGSNSAPGGSSFFVQPQRVSVPVSEAQGWGAAPQLDHHIANGTASTATTNNGAKPVVAVKGVWANGAALAKIKQAPSTTASPKPASTTPTSVVQQVFALEVQVPLTTPTTADSSSSPTASKNSSKLVSPRDSKASQQQQHTLQQKIAHQKLPTSIEALQYTKFLHLVNASALRVAAGLQTSFEQRLIAAETKEGSSVQQQQQQQVLLPMTRLLSRPKAVTFSIVWDSPQVSILSFFVSFFSSSSFLRISYWTSDSSCLHYSHFTQIQNNTNLNKQVATEALATFMSAIDTSLNVNKAFFTSTSTTDNDHNTNKPAAVYQLRGIVCYSRSHYKAFALNEEAKQWLLFDDAQVGLIGGWNQVVDVVVKQRLQPSVLFYECVV